MPTVLITGMSGVGKSSVAAELSRRGFVAVDTDAEAAVEAPDGEWLWDEPRVEEALSRAIGSQPIFIVGSASNQVRFYDRFNVIVLLTAPAALMIQRVRTRTTNPFGSSDEDRRKILADKAMFEPMIRRRADIEISTDQPLDMVVEAVLATVPDR